LDDCYCDWKMNTKNQTEIELWEAFFVEKGDRAPYPPNGRDIWHRDPSNYFEQCGQTTIIGEARFFLGTTTGYLKDLWEGQGVSGASKDGSTKVKPVWWDTMSIEKERPMVNGAPSFRFIKHEYCCCNPPSMCGGKTFARLTITVRDQQPTTIEY